MRRSSRLALPLAVAAAWASAGSTLLPLPISTLAGALCVLVLPGLALERLLHAAVTPYGAASAPARWITLSVALLAVLGLPVSATGSNVHALLLAVAAASLALVIVPVRAHADADTRSRSEAGLDTPNASTPLPDEVRAERVARAALVLVVVVAVVLAAAAPNVARDRMWYLAFVTRLANDAPIDWSEPFLGTGATAVRFAYNGWLLALAAWSSLTGATSSLVFERLAPPLLTVATASAAWHFSRRTVPRAPALATLASMAALLATRFPFFSPDRYPFFARIAEDKSAALLVFAPVALVALADAVERGRRSTAATWAALALTIVAVAFGHGLVMFLVGIAIASLWLVTRGRGETSGPRVLAAVLLAAIVAAVPARMAILARDRIVDIDEPAAAWSNDVTHPVVRAHLRLERSRELPLGGPIVDPKLLDHPLLLAGLAGIVVAWRKRRETASAILVAASVPFVALAFVPFVAPAFGRIVLPWMAYRALWPIPFGSLLALLAVALTRQGSATLVRGGLALVLVATTLAALPWDRTSARPDVVSPLHDRDTRDVLARIATLPSDARIAAAPGFAELVPALAGRAVVAVADRGTFVFAGSREAAETRLRASATLIGLAPGSPRVRRAAAARADTTHFVLHGRECGRVGRELFRSGALRLCEIRHGDDGSSLDALLTPPTTVRVDAASASTVRAGLDTGFRCMPAPKREGDVFQWRRAGRWTAEPVSIRCRAKLEPPATGSLSLALAAELPRAREAILLRAVLRTTEGRKIVRHTAMDLIGRRPMQIALPRGDVRELRLRLTPAYLPYLNLGELLLREQRSIRE